MDKKSREKLFKQLDIHNRAIKEFNDLPEYAIKYSMRNIKLVKKRKN
ncbi:MAG: hypothetical protein ACQEQF_09080 [Bacillota bacterium]